MLKPYLEQRTPNDTLEASQKSIRKAHEAMLNIAEVLHEVHRSKCYRFHGFETLKDYVESEMNMHLGTARKLIRLYDVYVQENYLSFEDILDIGLDKLALILPLVANAPEEFVHQMLDIARDTTYQELIAIVKEMRKKDKPEDMKKALTDMFKEQMCNLFNCSWSEAIFKLALFFSTPLKTDPLYLHALKKEVKAVQRQFEENLSSRGPDIFEGSSSSNSSDATSLCEAAISTTSPSGHLATSPIGTIGAPLTPNT